MRKQYTGESVSVDDIAETYVANRRKPVETAERQSPRHGLQELE
jgi:hypothetical protein